MSDLISGAGSIQTKAGRLLVRNTQQLLAGLTADKLTNTLTARKAAAADKLEQLWNLCFPCDGVKVVLLHVVVVLVESAIATIEIVCEGT